MARTSSQDQRPRKCNVWEKKACELLATSPHLALNFIGVYACWELSIACQTLEPQTLTQS